VIFYYIKADKLATYIMPAFVKYKTMAAENNGSW